jgi:hypothetical protein
MTTVGEKWGTSQTVRTVLNGGYIGKSTIGDKYMLRTNVLRELGGVLPLPQTHYKYYEYAFAYSNSDSNVGGNEVSFGKPGELLFKKPLDVVSFQRNTTGGNSLSYVSYIKDGTVHQVTSPYVLDYVDPANNGQICSHTTDSCPWVEKVSGSTDELHYNSTTAHAMGGQKWWDPHKPQQYAS